MNVTALRSSMNVTALRLTHLDNYAILNKQ